jgi:ribosomal protein S18 acetylase RimI-like enzyme
MVVRAARSNDADTIADVFVASFAGLTYLPRLHTEDEQRAWIKGVVLRDWEIWVAEDGVAVVGFAALSERTLELLYVHPDSQNRGAGTALLERAKRRRLDGFRLRVFQRNEGARRFYERHGLRLVTLTDGADNMEREPDALYEWRPPD